MRWPGVFTQQSAGETTILEFTRASISCLMAEPMLRRQRQIRTRVQQLVDAGLFIAAFRMAHATRANWEFLFFWERPEILPFGSYAWLILVIVLITPPLLEFQGFYDRPLLASRRQTVWQLFRACAWATIIIILVSFLAREQPARGVIILFGGISFLLVLIKEEIVRRWVQSKFGQGRLKKRLLLAGAAAETSPLRAKLKAQSQEGVEIPSALDSSHQSKVDKLGETKPESFASQYDPMQVSAHKDAVSLFERYAKGGDNADLKDWTGKTLPALKHHLEMAQDLDKKPAPTVGESKK